MRHASVDEALWRVWPLLDTLPRLAPPPTGRVVIVSAHPDDEVLAAGGLIGACAGTAASLAFVTVTDGAASHPGSSSPSPVQLAEQRSLELLRALDVLGHPDPDITRLGLPDSDLGPHLDALACGIDGTTEGADLVLCPATDDGHVDHATVGEVTVRVCSGRVAVWQFPIWLWHWSEPGVERLPWERAGRLDLSDAQRASKREALTCFPSQVQPLPGCGPETTILPPEVLAHFGRPYEVFFT